MYNENKENRINYKESSLLEEFDIYDSLHAVQPVSTIMMNGIRYYTKIHTSDTPVNIWNDLYGKNTGRFFCLPIWNQVVGSRYVERCWGFPYLRTNKFQSFKVSEFQSFKMSKFRGFKSSEFQSFNI